MFSENFSTATVVARILSAARFKYERMEAQVRCCSFCWMSARSSEQMFAERRLFSRLFGSTSLLDMEPQKIEAATPTILIFFWLVFLLSHVQPTGF